MKSARSSVKAQPSGLPYSSAANTYRHHNSLLTRLADRVGATVAKLNPLRRFQQQPNSIDGQHIRNGSAAAAQSHATAPSALVSSFGAVAPQLLPGDVLRDVPFFIQTAEVAYLSSHPSLCADVFGVVPGEVWEMMLGSGGALLGHVAVVVGARGGKLWVLVCGETSARAVHVPHITEKYGETAASHSSAEVRAAVMAYHDARLLLHPHRALTAVEEAEARQFGSAHAVEKDGESEMHAQMHRAQQEELTSRIRQVQADYTALRARATSEAQRVYTAEQRAFLQRAPDLYVAALSENAEEARAEHEDVELQAGIKATSSVYAAVVRGDAGARAVVLLPPRILVATGTVGWTGEGDVALLASPAGPACSEGSLSASVVL